MKKRTICLILALILVTAMTGCADTANSGSETGEGEYRYSEVMYFIFPDSTTTSSVISQVAKILETRLDNMGYRSSVGISEEKIEVKLFLDKYLLRNEREEIIKRLTMTGNLAFSGSDGKTALSREDFSSVYSETIGANYICFELNESGREKFKTLTREAAEKWNSVGNYVALTMEKTLLAKNMYDGESDEAVVRFSADFSLDDIRFLIEAYENPLPAVIESDN